MADADTSQRDYWNGEVGERWARNQTRLDAAFAPLTRALLGHAALEPGSSVLDIGCGAGDSTLAAARRLGPSGRIVGADVSAPLLAVARARAAQEGAEAAQIAFVEADAQTHDFGDAAFAHVISRFGVMFFAESVAAFANLRHALVPGGRLHLLCWRGLDDNPWIALPRSVVLSLVPEPEPTAPDAPGPFRFADRDRLAGILTEAGFRDIACDAIDVALTLGQSGAGSATESANAAADAAAAFVLELGPPSRLLRDQDAALRAEAHAEVALAFAARAKAGTVSLGAGCWLVSATR